MSASVWVHCHCGLPYCHVYIPERTARNHRQRVRERDAANMAIGNIEPIEEAEEHWGHNLAGLQPLSPGVPDDDEIQEQGVPQAIVEPNEVEQGMEVEDINGGEDAQIFDQLRQEDEDDDRARRIENDQGLDDDDLPEFVEYEDEDEDEDGDDEDDEEFAEFPFDAGRGMFTSPLLNEALYPEARVNLKEALLAIFKFTNRNKVSEEGLKDLLLLLRKVLLPEDNTLPRTLYKLYDLIDLNVDHFERHVCVNGCTAFPSLDKSDWPEHFQDRCPKAHCQEYRFQKKCGAISPRMKFYYIPMRYQLENLRACNPFWNSLNLMATNISQGRASELTSVWGGQLLRPFLIGLGHPANFMRNLACSMGMDGVNCYKNSTYSVIPVATKILNLHEADRTSGDFIMLNSVIPGPKKPPQYAGYLQPYFEEIKASKIAPEGCAGFSLTLSMTEQDHVMMCDTTEHLAAAATCNCPRCCVRAVPNPATGRGKYIVGYRDQSATNAPRKTNEFTRETSRRVERNEISESLYGIRERSVFAREFPDFDVCYGEQIEFFHKLQIVTPSTFWKDHIFAAIPDEGPLPIWIMSKPNRAIFSKRIAAVRPTHDLGGKPKDPSCEKLKAHDWDVFIVTCSPLAQDLLPQAVFDIWKNFLTGYNIHVHSEEITQEKRVEAASAWLNFAKQAEEHMPITMMTLSTHFVGHEADLQVTQTGPIKDSMSSWIERLCGTLVEDIRRRRICYSPEKTMIRAFLIRQYLLGHAAEVPNFDVEPRAQRDPHMYDTEDPWGVTFLGKGSHHNLSGEERRHMLDHFATAGVITRDQVQEIPLKCLKFTRSKFKTEIHGKEYGGTSTTTSCHVAINFIMNGEPREYYGRVEKFFRVELLGQTYKLAFVSCFTPLAKTRYDTVRLTNTLYATDRIVGVACINRKVIFHKIAPNQTWVLEVPLSRSQ